MSSADPEVATIRRTALALAAAALALTACAGTHPSEALVRPEGSPVGLVVPAAYQAEATEVEGVPGVELLRRAEGSAGGAQPQGRILHRRLPDDVVERLARRDLRMLGEGLDPVALSRARPGSVEVLDYRHIAEEGWWGSRIRVIVPDEADGAVVLDRLVLVGRAHGDLVEAEFACTAQCFGAFADEIDGILSSWTTEEQP